jgi:formylglycine-generating enzyme required for sulfatase activity
MGCVYLTSGGLPITVSSSSLTIDSSSGSIDNPVINSEATGFRLPTADEWDYAARYRGDDSTNAVLMSGLYWTKGNSASGAAAAVSSQSETVSYAVCNASGLSAVASKSANKLGLYDMSGNASELCFDWFTENSFRLFRGGSYSDDYTAMSLGLRSTGFNPGHYDASTGFRVVRTR